MIQPESEQQQKKGFLERLPKLGRVSQLILLIVGFLIVFLPLWYINNLQEPQQVAARATLANLQKILSISETPKAKYEAELAQITAETEAAKAVLPSSNQAPEIVDSLLELAELNDIYVTQTKISSTTPKDSIGPVLTITLGLRGQMPKFQNFLLALDDKLPTSEIKQLNFSIVTEEAEGAEDTANVTLDILCYEGG